MRLASDGSVDRLIVVVIPVQWCASGVRVVSEGFEDRRFTWFQVGRICPAAPSPLAPGLRVYVYFYPQPQHPATLRLNIPHPASQPLVCLSLLPFGCANLQLFRTTECRLSVIGPCRTWSILRQVSIPFHGLHPLARGTPTQSPIPRHSRVLDLLKFRSLPPTFEL